MAIVTRPASLVALTAIMAMAPAIARAQDERLRFSFIPAVATVSGDAELALGGSFGYRFAERFWFEGELTWIDAAAGGLRDRDFELDIGDLRASSFADLLRLRDGLFGRGGILRGIRLPAFPNLPTVPEVRVSTDGSTMVGTLGIRYELPVQTERFRPYVAGGLGINNTEQELHVERTRLTPEFDESVSHTGFAFNAGAGASVRLFDRLWADMEAKYFRLSRERNIMRLGGGVTVRF
jgi:opacity protein-like surface antigen